MRLGMTLAELIATGLTADDVKKRVYEKYLVFQPALPRQKAGPIKISGHACPCLGCRRKFTPSHRFNRLCERCTDRASQSSPYEL
jgi:hypothetical protein